MSNAESRRRIRCAYYLDEWDYEGGDFNRLKKNARSVLPSEYDKSMKGSLFCPECYTNLNRVPHRKDHYTNGRDAHFSHIHTHEYVPCNLRVSRSEGKKYSSIELARTAIDKETLVIVKRFIRDKPTQSNSGDKESYAAPIDQIGPIIDVPISRHIGETFSLPSIVTTVAGICRNFEQNRLKYYRFPKQKSALRLNDQINSVEYIKCKDDVPKLYFGRIIETNTTGKYKNHEYIRMTGLKNNIAVDFTLKQRDKDQRDQGITDDSVGRVVLVYGKVTSNGIGLCFENLGWGDFALLPTKYEKHLYH